MGVFQSGQMGQTVNLLSFDFGGSNPLMFHIEFAHVAFGEFRRELQFFNSSIFQLYNSWFSGRSLRTVSPARHIS